MGDVIAPPAPQRLPAHVYFKILLATVLWGSAFPIVKLGFQYASPLQFAGMRFVLAGLLLLALSLLFRKADHAQQRLVGTEDSAPFDWPRVLLIGLCSTCIFYGLFFLGMSKTSASSGAVVDGAGPVISAIMAHFVLHNDRLSSRKLVAILLAFVGVAIISLGRVTYGASEVSGVGCLLILAGLVVSATGTMLVITYRGMLRLMQLTGCQMLFGGALLLLVGGLFEPRPQLARLMSMQFVGILLWLGFVSAIAFRIWYGLVRRYKLTSIAVYSFLTATWGAIFSIVFLDDRVSVPLVTGLVLVGSGVIIMNSDRTSFERHPEATKPTEA